MGVKITQETFNKAVKENIEELGMDEKEAIEDAYKQFELQVILLFTLFCSVF